MFLTVLLSSFCLASSVAVAPEMSACSVQQLKTNLSSCLDGIRQVAMDDSYFWFGIGYEEKCPPEQMSIPECFNPSTKRNQTLAELTFGVTNEDLSTIDRYIHVTFISESGSYTGCDYKYMQNVTRSFAIDPLSNVAIKPWHLRALPTITWDYAPSDLFTLIFIDTGMKILHAMYVNIAGNDMANSTVLVDYRGPLNWRAVASPYTFLLYRQTSTINATSLGRNAFNVTQVAQDLSLQGPVGFSWVLAFYDAYSTRHIRNFMPVQNCALLVETALLAQKRKFLPATAKLSVYLRLQVTTKAFAYPCGSAGKRHRPATSFWADPIGQNIINTADVRTDATLKFTMELNSQTPNNSIDFKGKLYSLVILDPDIPAVLSSFGDTQRPLLHGLIININENNVETGYKLKPYIGPKPPDGRRHTYYFLLYEQKSVVSMTDTADITETCASKSLMGRCLFNTTAFTSKYDLDLVGATWISATTDDYVMCQRNVHSASVKLLPASYMCLTTLVWWMAISYLFH